MSTTPTHGGGHAGPSRPLFIAQQQHPTSAPPPPPPLPPPPAPPLPSGKYVQRAATAFGRLAHPFFLGSRPSSAHGHREREGRLDALRPAVQRGSSPASSKSTSHKTGIPIAALDISPERTHAVLAGRDILKTVKITGASCAEDFNLRAKLSAYASTHHASRDAIAAQHKDQLAAKDVKWSSGNYSTTIATAAANGRIVVYDLNRPSIEIGRLHEHTRQVHKLAYNPANPALLISGSQDGSVRMWDMRDLRTDRAVRITGCFRRFMGHSEGVRDLKWSPSDGVEFATGTDAGTIERWDMRKENAPLLKLNAHDKTCMSIDWHPSGRYLASGSVDKTIKIWDFRSTDRRMKANWQLRAPQSVMNVKWRPMSTLPGEGSRNTTFLASSYDNRDPRIHIWDFRRPHVPFQEIDRYDTSATDFLWHSEDLIWSVGIAGMFTQTDLNFVPRPIDRVSVNVLATGPEADFCFFSEYRPMERRPLADAQEQLFQGKSDGENSGEKLSGSHEGSYEESHNHPNTLKKRRQKHANSQTTPQSPNANGFAEEAKSTVHFSLDAFFRSSQVAAVGSILGVLDSESFTSLAKGYQYPESTAGESDEAILDSMRARFEQNADTAAAKAQHRLAQTWRILGHALYTELLARSKALHSDQASKATVELPLSALPQTSGASIKSPILTHNSEVTKVLQGLTTLSESGSNVATPLAHPVREMPSIAPADEHSLENEHKSVFKSPPWEQRRASVQLNAPHANVAENINTKIKAQTAEDPLGLLTSVAEFPDLERQMQERRSAMNNYRARPRTLLRLDDPIEETASPAEPLPPLDRHNSNESFQMFSGSADSDPRSVALAGSFEDRSVGTPAGNSLASSGAPDFTLAHQMHRSRSRESHAVTHNSNANHRGADNSASPWLEDVGFSMDDGDTAAEDRKDPSIQPPQIFRPNPVPPLIHLVLNAQDGKKRSSRITSTSLLLAHPLTAVVNNPPWSISALLPPLLEYHLETLCDTQLPSFLALFLYPFCPALFASSPPPPVYLLSYHEMLISFRLFPEAAALRKAASRIFPDMGIETTVDQGRGTAADQAGLWCDVCRRPIKGDVRGWCKRCCKEWAECAVCELPHPPAPTDLGLLPPESQFGEVADQASGTILWSWCQGCGHGGHTRCLQAWWRAAGDGSKTDSSCGACPTVGCAHACVVGPLRDARLAGIAALSKRARGSSVARDSWVAGESRAVEAATRTLGGGRGSAGSGGITSGSAPGPGVALGAGAGGRVSLEEAVVVEESDRGGSIELTPGSAGLSGGFIKSRSLSGGGRSLSGGGRRVRLVVPGTTPPAAATAVAGLREQSAAGRMEPLLDEGSEYEASFLG